jgi:hypothetical protein
VGQRWTRQEDDVLRVSSSFEDFRARAAAAGLPERTKSQAHNRKQRIKADGQPVLDWVSGITPMYEQPESAARVQLESLELPERGDRALDEYYALVKQISNVQRLRKEETKTIEWTAPVDGWIGLAFPGDLHIGGPIDYDQLEADLDLIEATDGLWCVGLGDYSNNFQAAAKLLKAMAEDVVPGSEDQMALVAHVMGRTSKWLAILEGNHDTWSGSAGLKTLSRLLGADHISEAGCSIKMTVGHQRYVGYLKHSWKGHSNLNTSNESRRMWNEFPEWENADFTVLAHYHQPDTHQKEIKTQTVVHLRGGTYKSYDPYASKNGYVPEYGVPLVLLNPDAKEIIPFHARNWRRGVEMLGMLRSRVVMTR